MLNFMGEKVTPCWSTIKESCGWIMITKKSVVKDRPITEAYNRRGNESKIDGRDPLSRAYQKSRRTIINAGEGGLNG